LQRDGVDAQGGVDAGLLRPREGGGAPFALFRDRLMFPIRSASGRVVAFGGRTLSDDRAKYVNTPETDIYTKSSVLFGLYEARRSIQKEDGALVVEGYFDVLALARAGIGVGVAPCGTALTDRQLGALRRHTKHVTLMFDADAAGKRAAHRALDLCLAQGLWPSYLSVPDGKDPDEYVRTHGADAMRALLASARPLLGWVIEESRRERLEGRDAQEIVDELAPSLNMLPADTAQQNEQVAALQMALGFAVNDRTVSEAMRRAGRNRAAQQRRTEAALPLQGTDRGDDAASAQPAQGGTPAAPRIAAPSAPERQLLRLLLQDRDEVVRAAREYDIAPWVAHPDVRIALRLATDDEAGGRATRGESLMHSMHDSRAIAELSGMLASDRDWVPEARLERALRECLMRLRLDAIARETADARLRIDALSRGGGDRAEIFRLVEACRQLGSERNELAAELARNS
jgi:DNA primase